MNITDELLLDSYHEANKLQLDTEFIDLLRDEMEKRNLEAGEQQEWI